MTTRAVILAGALAAGSLATLPAATPFMPIEDVHAGQQGVGRTVFSGETREEFKVHILGVLKNVVGPQRNLILARLEGGPLAAAGVMQGMSGSPVYLDGRLVGAVSYSLGSFSKEPIAGITPIGEMVEATASTPARSASARIKLDLPLTPERLTEALRSTLARVRPFANEPGELEVIGLSRQAGATLGLQLRPIDTPVVMNGFDGPAVGLLGAALADAGFTPVFGAPPALLEPAAAPLEPGDAVGVVLASGDLEMAATGTVTYVDGTRVYAFGHPFFNLGPTSFPMTRASVATLLPSYMTSQKIAVLGPVVGTFEQDRATAIAGRLGPGPALIPMRISLESGRGFKKTFSFGVANDEFFTPLLTYLAVANTLASYERQMGTATFTVNGTAKVAGHEALQFGDVFAGGRATANAAAYVSGPVTLLMGNDLEPARVESLDLSITASEQPRTASIERAWIDAARVRPGDTVPLRVLVRQYGGEDTIYTVSLAIPANAPSRLSVLVADGASLGLWERREQQTPQQPANVEQMIRLLNSQRRNSRLYVRLVGAGAGAVVNGEKMPSLPPSVLSVLESDKNGGSFARLHTAILGAWDIQTEQAISGSRQLSIAIDTGRP